MDDRKPAAITVDADGTVKTYEEVPASLAVALLENHANHDGIFFVPDCPHCQNKWPDGQGWGS